MNIEKRPCEVVIDAYMASLSGKKLNIVFSNMLEDEKEKKIAYFLQYNRVPLHELDRVAVDFAEEQTDDSTGDTILILKRQDIGFRFWKYDDGAFGAHYVLKSIECTDDQNLYPFANKPSRLQKYLLEKLSNKKLIITIAKLNRTIDAIRDNREFRVMFFDYEKSDFFPKSLLVMDINYPEVYYGAGQNASSYLRLLRDDVILTIRIRSDDDKNQTYGELVSVDLAEQWEEKPYGDF